MALEGECSGPWERSHHTHLVASPGWIANIEYACSCSSCPGCANIYKVWLGLFWCNFGCMDTLLISL